MNTEAKINEQKQNIPITTGDIVGKITDGNKLTEIYVLLWFNNDDKPVLRDLVTGELLVPDNFNDYALLGKNTKIAIDITMDNSSKAACSILASVIEAHVNKLLLLNYCTIPVNIVKH